MTDALKVGNLVRWSGGQLGADVGVVVETLMDGQRARVRLDAGEDLTFVRPFATLERLKFIDGAHMIVLNDGHIGVVVGQSEIQGVFIYRLSFPDGAVKSIPEGSLRPAPVTDPVELLRRGGLGSPFSMNLRIAATRLLFAHQYDELSSLSNSRVEIKPHQVGVLHRVASTYPHRFLLSDEVGLGKTVEAGLIIKELKARGVANRVLVLAPSGIVSQWQFELKTKFNEGFAWFTKETIAYLTANNPDENVWSLHDNVIASTTYAAWDERRRNEIALAGWDLVVIDEAHHARRQSEGASRYSETNLYRLAAQLADPEQGGGTSALLLLTATPMQLDHFELYSLIELLDPALFADFDDFSAHVDSVAGLNRTVDSLQRWSSLPEDERQIEAATAASLLDRGLPAVIEDLETIDGRTRVIEELLQLHRLSDVLIRNRKSVVGGFMPRRARVWAVPQTTQETEAYAAVTEYVRTGYARSQASRNNAIGFLMATFQKMNASSSYTLGKSLMRRIIKLEEGLAPPSVLAPDDEDALDELAAEEALGDFLALTDQVDRLEEIDNLRRVVQLMDAIEIDSKARALTEGLLGLRLEEPGIRVLIFTQYRDTQEYLADKLRVEWDVDVFHGKLDPKQKDEAIARFRDEPGPRILISTEAGGEGRNLQFCHTMVNYDLPWNPMKIEQRIGRLDRIGQRHPVTIINLAVEGTIEERVLRVLENRIRVFEDTVGGLDPILGTVENDLRRLFFLSAEDHGRAIEAYEADLETKVLRARGAESRLADLIMDTRSFRQDEVRQLLERKSLLDPASLRQFVLKALVQLSVRVAPDEETAGVFELRFSSRFAIEFPKVAKEGMTRRVTFDPSVALDFETVEFLAFGHEIVDGLVARVRRRDYEGASGVRVVSLRDATARRGWFFTFVLEFEGVVGSKEIYPVFVDESGVLDAAIATRLFDESSRLRREDAPDGTPVPSMERLETMREIAEGAAIGRLLERQAELAAINRSRLDQERAKLVRYYEYRERAASAKLESVRRTFERLSASEQPEVQRILPVWAKNLETASRVAATVVADRDRRLGELAGRDQVSAQHEMLTAAFVWVVPG